MEALMMGADVGKPVVLRLVMTIPVVCGIRVVNDGRIWTVPELAEVVVTETLAVMEELRTEAKWVF